MGIQSIVMESPEEKWKTERKKNIFFSIINSIEVRKGEQGRQIFRCNKISMLENKIKAAKNFYRSKNQ